ncbi:hypothetical protein ACVWXO_010819 [Bradyrhizobium sp. LM2.7]
MQMHESPKSKMVAFYEGLAGEHCVSTGPHLTTSELL